MAAATSFTKTELKILEILSDGEPHRIKVMHKECCGPSSISAFRTHICRLRAKLPAGEDIVCTTDGRVSYYQHVRLLSSANDGRK